MSAKHRKPGKWAEARFEADRLMSVAKRGIAEAEAELANVAERRDRQLELFLETGIDIGTREEANSRSGPYADQRNADRLTVYMIGNRIGKTVIDR